MIDRATVDRIYEAAKIVEVVSDFVTLRKRGVNYIGCCPFHNEKTPSFSVSPTKDIFKCFGCGKAGNAVTFVMEHESMSYVDALRYLAKKYHIEIQEKELTPEEIAHHTDRESMLVLNSYAQKYFSTILQQHVEGKNIGLSYFKERGFREDTIQKFQLGYALEERDAFTKEALKNGYKKEYLVKTGLTIEGEKDYLADRFRGRVLFPIHGLSGKVLGFGGRVLKTDAKTAKYLNSPASEIYDKSNELYGIYFAKQSIVRTDCCYLVEGYTDVISMHQAGIENVVASSGTSLTVGQIRLIRRFTPNITVIYDGDAAGIKASIRGIDLLLEEGMNVKVLLLPDGEDPDSFARKQDSSEFIQYINENQTDFIGFKTKLLLEEAGKDPVKRALLIADIVKSIAVIPDNIMRSVYISECSKTLDIQEEILYAEINKHSKSKFGNGFSQRKEAVSQLYESERKAMFEQRQAAVVPQSDLSQKTDMEMSALQIIRLLVRYGGNVLFENSNEATSEMEKYTVADYIVTELENDALSFENPLHQQMLSETKQFAGQEWHAENYFKNHVDIRISSIAVNMIAEPHQLSKMHQKDHQFEPEEKRLIQLVPRVILEYKNKVISIKEKNILLAFKAAQDAKNQEEMNRLDAEYCQLIEIRKILAKELGDRIVLK